MNTRIIVLSFAFVLTAAWPAAAELRRVEIKTLGMD